MKTMQVTAFLKDNQKFSNEGVNGYNLTFRGKDITIIGNDGVVQFTIDTNATIEDMFKFFGEDQIKSFKIDL